MKTYSAKAGEVERRWFVVDAEGVPLGRLASRLAMVLQGKNKPVYTRHIDTGDFVVVVNASKVGISGNKVEQEVYYRHSRYPGGQKATTMKVMSQKHPDRLIRRAVWGMMPKGILGRAMIRKLKVYAGPEHPHAAQQPEPLDVRE